MTEEPESVRRAECADPRPSTLDLIQPVHFKEHLTHGSIICYTASGR
jgi:hypothetical protein